MCARNDNTPRASEDWVSARKLRQNGVVGNLTQLNRMFAKVHDLLVQDLIVNDGFTHNDACSQVNSSMIGIRKNANGQAALFMSPQCVSMLVSSAQIRYRWDLPPPPAKGWRSAWTMTPVGGLSTVNLKDRMQRLKNELADDITTATGTTHSEAEAIVEKFLIGLRKSPTGGSLTLYASPDAQRILEDTKPLRWGRRVKGEEPPVQGGPPSQGR